MQTITEKDFTRISSDVNGNPRYAIHYLSCCPEAWLREGYSASKYQRVVKLMNAIGGRKYHTKGYGGGIVFQSYNLKRTAEAIQSKIESE